MEFDCTDGVDLVLGPESYIFNELSWIGYLGYIQWDGVPCGHIVLPVCDFDQNNRLVGL